MAHVVTNKCVAYKFTDLRGGVPVGLLFSGLDEPTGHSPRGVHRVHGLRGCLSGAPSTPGPTFRRSFRADIEFNAIEGDKCKVGQGAMF